MSRSIVEAVVGHDRVVDLVGDDVTERVDHLECERVLSGRRRAQLPAGLDVVTEVIAGGADDDAVG